MIAAFAVIGGGIAFIVLVAIVVGIVDAANAATWRQVAAERRQRWEDGRTHAFHGMRRDGDDRPGPGE